MAIGTESSGPVRVVDYLVRAIEALGIHHVFGVDGANIEDLYDAIFDAGGPVQGVVAKHEFSAATMADGYARSTSGLGVVAATSGGGAMNLVSGLAEAFTSRVPVLALIGQPPMALEGNGAFQDTSGRAGSIDALRLFSELSRYCARVERAEDIEYHLERAVREALQGGPGILLLPKDIQQEMFEPKAPFVRPTLYPKLDIAAIDAVRAQIGAARLTGKIVIIAGDQVARDDARRQLRMLVNVLDATVGVAPDAKDVYGSAEHGFSGVSGVMGNVELVDAVRHSSLCILVGTRMAVTSKAGLDAAFAQTQVVSIGAELPFVAGMHATSGDLAGTLAALAAALHTRTHAEPPASARPTRLRVPEASGPGLRYRDAVDAIAAMMPAGSDVFADAGNTGAAVVHHLPVDSDGRFVVALGMGGMGYSFGAAIGSACARNRRTFAIAGDGSFYMHGMEIHTAIELNLPVTFIVFNNNAHAMCVTREQIFYRNRYSFNRFRPALLGEGIAAMFPTLPAFAARNIGELTDALAGIAETEGPQFISVDCDPDEIPPFVPFLNSTPIEETNP
ncbi:thiamine pyrophosphate-binding protein [Antrihabitans sp. YC2-6]|uniref:thiamine pyrophosphate-binding protein n=1 Tax=Antrihabitans sp. YC2-6 TaxID=2799498 RepID=UPI0018F5F50D|nr:thiamine pyrophosphate-binding protein [Antrihabitans sp. YC2-6]MBJ8347682.1 thiamine pyrophosphate-binding protein [Antrihabitans sp. YC2-6]